MYFIHPWFNIIALKALLAFCFLLFFFLLGVAKEKAALYYCFAHLKIQAYEL